VEWAHELVQSSGIALIGACWIISLLLAGGGLNLGAALWPHVSGPICVHQLSVDNFLAQLLRPIPGRSFGAVFQQENLVCGLFGMPGELPLSLSSRCFLLSRAMTIFSTLLHTPCGRWSRVFPLVSLRISTMWCWPLRDPWRSLASHVMPPFFVFWDGTSLTRDLGVLWVMRSFMSCVCATPRRDTVSW